jgi:site-specific DNA recombinase
MEATKRATHHSKPLLRFACLIRVSTPGQEKRGESLEVQRDKLTRIVTEDLGGTIPRHGWFLGQESSTPGADRKLLDDLLDGVRAGRFDCVIVDDLSRWSRDGLRSELALQVLKDHDVRFYVGGLEHDLFNPLNYFMVQTGVNFSQLYSMVAAEKSIRSKIKKAQEGKPSVGNLPWGRTYDKDTQQWGVDAEKAKMIREAARDFVSGTVTMAQLEARTGLVFTQLYDLFRGGAGAEWTVHFRPKKFPRLHTDVTLKVPALLDERTLRLLKRKIARGRTFFIDSHGKTEGQFLFRKMLFCGACGYAVSGANINGHKYYVHGRSSGKHKIPCRNFSYVPAETLEGSVMAELFFFFGDKHKRREALRAANAGMREAEKLREEIKRAQAELSRVQKQQERLIDQASRGILPEAKIQAQMAKLMRREGDLKARAEALEDRVANTPTEEQIKQVADAFGPKKKRPPRPTREDAEEEIMHSYYGSQKHFHKMTFDDKRKMLTAIFGSAERSPIRHMKRGEKLAKFTKAGIYVERTDRGWRYKIRGAFQVMDGHIWKQDALKVSIPTGLEMG